MSQGLSCTLFERNAILGGVWADGYSNFGVQVQKELYEFPDWPLPTETPDFTPGPTVQDYLTNYADHFGITPHICFSATVAQLKERSDANPGWTVLYRDRTTQHEADFDMIVVCIGLYSNVPNMPKFLGQDQFNGEIMHISRLKSR